MIGQDSSYTNTHTYKHTHTHTHIHTLVLDTLWTGFADLGLPIHSIWQIADELNSNSPFSTTLSHSEHCQDPRLVRLLVLYRSVKFTHLTFSTRFSTLIYIVCYSKSLIQYLMSLTVQCRMLCKTLKAVDIFCIPYFDIEFSGWTYNSPLRSWARAELNWRMVTNSSTWWNHIEL